MKHFYLFISVICKHFKTFVFCFSFLSFFFYILEVKGTLINRLEVNIKDTISTDSLDSDVGLMIFPKDQDYIISIGCFEAQKSCNYGFRAYTLHDINNPIVSNRGGFATYSDTSLLSWGDFYSGGNYLFSLNPYHKEEAITPYTPIPVNYNSAVVKIVPTLHSFGTLLADGSLSIRGSFYFTATSDHLYWDTSKETHEEGVENQPLVDLIGNDDALLGVLQDGSLIGWGNPEFGGNGLISITPGIRVSSVAHTPSAFIALLENNTLFTWGSWTKVYEELMGKNWFDRFGSRLFGLRGTQYKRVDDPGTTLTLPPGKTLDQIQEMIGIENGIALLFQDGSLAWWEIGMEPTFIMIPLGHGQKVLSVTKCNYGISALLNDQKVIYWSEPNLLNLKEFFPEQVSVPLEKGKPIRITSITSNGQSFAGTLANGGLVCWGDSSDGGRTPILPLKTKLCSLVGYENGFMGLLDSGELLLWGRYIKQDGLIYSFQKIIPPPKDKKISFITSTRLYPVVFYDDGSCSFFDTQSTFFTEYDQPIYSINYLKEVGHLLTPEEVSLPAYH